MSASEPDNVPVKDEPDSDDARAEEERSARPSTEEPNSPPKPKKARKARTEEQRAKQRDSDDKNKANRQRKTLIKRIDGNNETLNGKTCTAKPYNPKDELQTGNEGLARILDMQMLISKAGLNEKDNILKKWEKVSSLDAEAMEKEIDNRLCKHLKSYAKKTPIKKGSGSASSTPVRNTPASTKSATPSKRARGRSGSDPSTPTGGKGQRAKKPRYSDSQDNSQASTPVLGKSKLFDIDAGKPLKPWESPRDRPAFQNPFDTSADADGEDEEADEPQLSSLSTLTSANLGLPPGFGSPGADLETESSMQRKRERPSGRTIVKPKDIMRTRSVDRAKEVNNTFSTAEQQEVIDHLKNRQGRFFDEDDLELLPSDVDVSTPVPKKRRKTDKKDEEEPRIPPPPMVKASRDLAKNKKDVAVANIVETINGMDFTQSIIVRRQWKHQKGHWYDRYHKDIEFLDPDLVARTPDEYRPAPTGPLFVAKSAFFADRSAAIVANQKKGSEQQNYIDRYNAGDEDLTSQLLLTEAGKARAASSTTVPTQALFKAKNRYSTQADAVAANSASGATQQNLIDLYNAGDQGVRSKLLLTTAGEAMAAATADSAPSQPALVAAPTPTPPTALAQTSFAQSSTQVPPTESLFVPLRPGSPRCMEYLRKLDAMTEARQNSALYYLLQGHATLVSMVAPSTRGTARGPALTRQVQSLLLTPSTTTQGKGAQTLPAPEGAVLTPSTAAQAEDAQTLPAPEGAVLTPSTAAQVEDTEFATTEQQDVMDDDESSWNGFSSPVEFEPEQMAPANTNGSDEEIIPDASGTEVLVGAEALTNIAPDATQQDTARVQSPTPSSTDANIEEWDSIDTQLDALYQKRDDPTKILKGQAYDDVNDEIKALKKKKAELEKHVEIKDAERKVVHEQHDPGASAPPTAAHEDDAAFSQEEHDAEEEAFDANENRAATRDEVDAPATVKTDATSEGVNGSADASTAMATTAAKDEVTVAATTAPLEVKPELTDEAAITNTTVASTAVEGEATGGDVAGSADASTAVQIKGEENAADGNAASTVDVTAEDRGVAGSGGASTPVQAEGEEDAAAEDRGVAGSGGASTPVQAEGAEDATDDNAALVGDAAVSTVVEDQGEGEDGGDGTD